MAIRRSRLKIALETASSIFCGETGIRTYPPNVEICGNYKVIDDKNQVLENYDISVLIPKTYPNGFPTLIEKSTKIPREKDRHINEWGEACVELTHKAILRSRNGISIERFFQEYVHRYFCWQLLYEIDKTDLVEWAHDDSAISEFYFELLGINDLERISKLMEAALGKKKPSLNSKCICNSGKKYKRCHLNTYPSLLALGTAMITRDSILLNTIASP